MLQKPLILRTFLTKTNPLLRIKSFTKESKELNMTELNCKSKVEDMDLSDVSEGSLGEIEIIENSFEKRLRMLEDIRKLEYTTYGQNLLINNKLPEISDRCIKIVTYNVLSQELLESHKYLYRNCFEGNLNWIHRSRLLLREFQKLNPDILCLQEVQNDHLKSFYEPELGRLGYSGIYKQRTHDKIDGCAIYFKRDKFLVKKALEVELYKDNVRLLDRDNIGLIIKFSLKNDSSADFVVATTHLLYNPKRIDIKLTQTQLMLAEMEQVAYDNGQYWPVIFLGDMNYQPKSAIYQLVRNGSVLYENLPYSQGKAIPRHLLPRFIGITDSCQFEQNICERNVDRHIQGMRFGSGRLTHVFYFDSVYKHVKNGDSEATTHQDSWVTVDYIFYSRQKSNKANLKLISRLALPSKEEAQNVLGCVPNQFCGSDHLPLMATFHFLSRTP